MEGKYRNKQSNKLKLRFHITFALEINRFSSGFGLSFLFQNRSLTCEESYGTRLAPIFCDIKSGEHFLERNSVFLHYTDNGKNRTRL